MAKMSNPHTLLPGSLSRERVLRAAVCLADEGGIESLSMRKLAQDLGVKAMSLYNHVANKDDLLDGIVDIVVSEIEVPNLGVDWKTAMRGRAMSAHEVLLRHPWSTMPLVSRVNVGPAMLRYVDATRGCLRGAGFARGMAWGARRGGGGGCAAGLSARGGLFAGDGRSCVECDRQPHLWIHASGVELSVRDGGIFRSSEARHRTG